MSCRRRRRRRGATALLFGLLLPLLLLGLALAGEGSVPPPTPVPPRGSLSPFPSSLDTPADATREPELSAAAAVLADMRTGQVLYSDGATAPRAIASLTKMMSALLVLERAAPHDVVTVPSEAVFGAHDFGSSSTLSLRAGERITVLDLEYGMLIGSANDAAVVLADHVSGSVGGFVRLMNRKAASLGMRHTRFSSPNGLDDRGRSTASDVLRLVRAAYRDPLFARIVSTRERDIRSSAHVVRQVQNRNALLWLYPGAIGVKTGATSAAGECVAAVAQRSGLRLVAVVLGAPREPFSDAATLLNFGFAGFENRSLAEAGDPEGELSIRGGTVSVLAGAGLKALVARSAIVRTRLVADPSAAYPPAPGERVGTLLVTSSGKALGSVPLLATVPSLPPPPAGPWWLRAGEAVGRSLGRAIDALS